MTRTKLGFVCFVAARNCMRLTWLSYDLTELWLDWAITWLSYDLTELLLDWAMTWLSYDLTELWLDWAIELRSHSYIGRFSTKLPLIMCAQVRVDSTCKKTFTHICTKYSSWNVPYTMWVKQTDKRTTKRSNSLLRLAFLLVCLSKISKAKTDNRISLGSRGDSFYVTGLQPSSGCVHGV